MNEVKREMMVCSRALDCDSLTCTHRKPHTKEYKCYAGTCSSANNEFIPCIDYTIKYERKNKLNKLECVSNVGTKEESRKKCG